MNYRKHLRNIINEEESDQRKGLPLPPIQKPYPEDGVLIELIQHEKFTIGDIPLLDAIIIEQVVESIRMKN